jgi:hypothetical protein
VQLSTFVRLLQAWEDPPTEAATLEVIVTPTPKVATAAATLAVYVKPHVKLRHFWAISWVDRRHVLVVAQSMSSPTCFHWS